VLTLTISTTPVRLVINQSIVPMEWGLRLKIRVSFRCLLSKVVFFVPIRYVIKHSVLIVPLICSRMCDLTFWARIWCVSGFVLKTRC
jgi:hypothetical protein